MTEDVPQDRGARQRPPAIEAVHDPGTIPAPGGARGPWIAILGLVISGPRPVGGDRKEDR
jgi:hypothetical protein